MPKSKKTPGSALKSMLEQYQISAFFLSKEIKVNYQILQHILKGEARITVPSAMKFGKYFGQSPFYWLDLQVSADVEELSSNKKFMSELNKIPKAKKPAAKGKKAVNSKAGKRKPKTLAEKRKKAEKVPGVKPSRGGKKIS